MDHTTDPVADVPQLPQSTGEATMTQKLENIQADPIAYGQPRPMLGMLHYRTLKRPLDIVWACGLLVLFGPLMALIAIAIKLHSPGPVLYRQQRIGRGGVPFMMLKFRSMRLNNDGDMHRRHMQRLIKENIRPEDLGMQSLKMERDPRITGVGKLLRKVGLDELPQLFNVLRGDMSLVGPRPPLPYEYELYTERHKQRLQVVPGLTGLWQVTAHNLVSFEEMVQLDLDYINTMSLRLDLQIMLSTPREMLRGKGGG